MPFKDGVAVANLATLGMEYIEQFNGSDELIRVARAEIDAYLKVESEWRGVDIKTLRKLSGFLEIWGEYPKVRPR